MRWAVLFFVFILGLSACNAERFDKVDPILDKDRNDYRSLHDEKPVPPEPPIPRMRLQLGEEPNHHIANDKIVSLNVSEKVPLKDVLRELAAKADVNLELDPRISGGVIFSAHRQPFSRVLDRLCNMAGLRYAVEDGFLRVELDEVYLKTYSVDYLTLIRKSRGDIGIATNVFANVQGNNARGNTSTNASSDAQNGNNSTTRVETEAVADFWAEVQGNIESILQNTKATKNLRVNADAEAAGVSAAKPYTINKQAGLITVFGNERQQIAIEKYTARLKRNINAQVLIEARIVEVNLDEGYKGGINWRTLNDNLSAAARFGAGATGGPFVTSTTATDGVVTLSLKENDFGGILNFVRSFGSMRTLSSPRLTVLNNQPAVLKVARNEVYFTSTIESTPVVSTGLFGGAFVQRTVNSTPNTVPVGFLMTVQPSINLARGEVTLNMRPTLSFIVDHVEDPSIKITAADAGVPEVSSSIPVVAVREMDSVLTLPSGTVAVMGGLMQDSAGNLENGVPFADEVPIAGNLAKSRQSNANLSELVILLRATIVDDGPKPDDADKELYTEYTRDRRPLPISYQDDGSNDDDAPPPIPRPRLKKFHVQ